MICAQPPSAGRSGQKGAALIVVMWTFTVLAALGFEFALAMRRDAESTRNFKQETLARYTAFAGLNEAILAIDTFNGELGYDDEERLQGDMGDTAADTEEGEEGLDLILTLIEGRGEWVEGHFEAVPYARYEVRAIDETGKVPLNADAVNEAVLREMMLNLGYDELTASTVADSIVDWRDEDDLHRANGAEDDYYRALERPYPCKDAPFDTLEELQLVRGVTRAMYYGRDDVPGLREIFTVAQDRARLQLRTAPEAVHRAFCGDPELTAGGEEGLDRRTEDQVVLDLQQCIEDLGIDLGVVRSRERRGNPLLGYATLEARVKDPQDETRIVAHIGAQVQFKGGGGFQTVQWYDSIFDE